jgi:hypothetical protein
MACRLGSLDAGTGPSKAQGKQDCLCYPTKKEAAELRGLLLVWSRIRELLIIR